jgi:hypothetical protein
MCGDGDALRGAGTPFAIVAVDLLMLARLMSIVSKSAAFTILSMLGWSGNRNSGRTPQMMTVYRLLAPKEVGERSAWGCQEGSPIADYL